MLKRYTDYTMQELANITGEELQRLIEIECMREGVSVFAVEPKLMTLPELPESDAVVYEIGSFSLTDEEEAKKLLELLKSFKSHCELDYEYGYGYQKKYVKPSKCKYGIDEIQAYSKLKYDEAKYVIKEREKLEEQNASMREKYEKEKEPYEGIKATVMDAYYEALREEERFITANGIYQKYLSLSNGDASTADNFFNQTSYSEYLERIKESANISDKEDK